MISSRSFINNPETEGKSENQDKMVLPILSLGIGSSGLILVKADRIIINRISIILSCEKGKDDV